MQYDMRALPEQQRYKILTASITPRPIAWISSQSADGVRNAAPYSFFNMMGAAPPVVAIGIMRHGEQRFKDSAANILDTGEFVVNLVSNDVAEAMNLTCIDAPPEVDELTLAGIETRPGVTVSAPRIAAAPVSLECRNLSSVVTGPGQMVVLGEVLMAHIHDDFILNPERCHIDTPKLDLIARLHGAGWYARRPELFQMERPQWQQWAPEHAEQVAAATRQRD